MMLFLVVRVLLQVVGEKQKRSCTARWHTVVQFFKKQSKQMQSKKKKRRETKKVVAVGEGVYKVNALCGPSVMVWAFRHSWRAPFAMRLSPPPRQKASALSFFATVFLSFKEHASRAKHCAAFSILANLSLVALHDIRVCAFARQTAVPVCVREEKDGGKEEGEQYEFSLFTGLYALL